MSCFGRSGSICLIQIRALTDFLSTWWTYGDRVTSEDEPLLQEDESTFFEGLSNVFLIFDENTPLIQQAERAAADVYHYLNGRSDTRASDSLSDPLSDSEPDPSEDQCLEGPLCEACRRIASQMRSHQLKSRAPIHDENWHWMERVPHLSYNTLSHSHHNCILCAKIWIRLPHEDDVLSQALGGLTGKHNAMLNELKDHTMLLSGRYRGTHFQLQVFASPAFRSAIGRTLDAPINFFPSDGTTSWTLKRNPARASNIGVSHSGHQSFRSRLRIIRSWMHTCRSSHKLCNRWRGTDIRWLPTRLVKIGNGPSETKLCIAARLSKETRYATLSHCWGQRSFTKLTENRLEDWHSSIPVHELPRTFIEALDACRDLGIAYIWIDSLCIVQDSRHDWAQEASTMHLVYKHSSLNLAAGASNDVSGGLFRSWNRFLSSNPLMKDVQGINFAGGSALSHFEDKESIRLDFQQSRLHHRAWVVQELFLSPRTLHFTTLNLWWQCKENMLSLWRFPNDSLQDIGRGLPCVYAPSHPQRDEESLLSSWSVLVEDYSAAELSYPQDKVIAFAGLSQYFMDYAKSHDPKQELLAGLWSHRLCFELLWFTTSRVMVGSDLSGPLIFILDENRASRHRDDYSTAQARPSDRVAPSWSWLSTSVPVSCSLTQYVGDVGWFSAKDGFGQCAGVIRSSLKLNENHRYKRMSSISLQAPMFWIRVEGHLPYIATGRGQSASGSKLHTDGTGSSIMAPVSTPFRDQEQAHIRCFFDDAYHRNNNALYCCVATLQHEAMHWIFRGIILQEAGRNDTSENEVMNDHADFGADGDRDGGFERVGVWCTDASWVDRDPGQLEQLRWIQRELMRSGKVKIY